MLIGFADYSFFYDKSSAQTMGTNIVMVEAKRRNDTGDALAQLIAYMGIVSEVQDELRSTANLSPFIHPPLIAHLPPLTSTIIHKCHYP